MKAGFIPPLGRRILMCSSDNFHFVNYMNWQRLSRLTDDFWFTIRTFFVSPFNQITLKSKRTFSTSSLGRIALHHMAAFYCSIWNSYISYNVPRESFLGLLGLSYDLAYVCFSISAIYIYSGHHCWSRRNATIVQPDHIISCKPVCNSIPYMRSVGHRKMISASTFSTPDIRLATRPTSPDILGALSESSLIHEYTSSSFLCGTVLVIPR